MLDDLDLKGFDGIGRLFPLPGVVLFPHVVLPLHIFEPRYRQMTEHALETDRLVTIVGLKDPEAVGFAERPAIESVGCLGQILNSERLPDGRFNFLLAGRKRVRIVEELRVDTLYRQARIEIIEDVSHEVVEDARKAELTRRFLALATAQGPIDPELSSLLDGLPPLGVLTDVLSHALGLPPAIKQHLLEEARVDRRADLLLGLFEQVERSGSAPPRRPSYPPPVLPN